MNKPTPLEKKFEKFDISTYDVSDLSFIEPDFITYAQPSNISIPQADEILTSYYTLTFKSVLSNSLDKFYDLFDKLTSYAYSKYQFLRNEFLRKTSNNFRKINSSFGLLGHFSPSGIYQKNLNDFYLNSLKDEIDLYSRYMEEHQTTVIKTLASFINEVYSANSLYRDVFERDFRVTYETYMLIMENAINEYNNALIRYRFMIELQNFYNSVYKELIEIERRKFERIKAVIAKRELEEKQKEIINDYYASYSKYLMELEKYNYLVFEEYKILLKRYENELRKFRTEIEQVNSISDLIKTRVQAYLSSLDAVEAKQAVKDIKLNVVLSKIKSENAKLEAKDSEIRANISSLRALLGQYEAEITRYESDLKKYNVDVERIISEYKKDIYDKILSLKEQEQQLVSYWENELKARDTYLDLKNQVIFYNEKVGREAYDKVRRAFDALRMATDVIRDYNRTMAIAYSSVTASIIRSFA